MRSSSDKGVLRNDAEDRVWDAAVISDYFIALGFIAFTLLVQFGVHIKVDEGVELVPVEIGYSQSIRRINSKSVHVSERYVRLKYENDAQKSFWVPAPVVFGRASDDMEDMIKDGVSINRNVFLIQNPMRL